MAEEYGIPLPIRPDSVPPVPILTHSMRSDFGSVMADAARRGLLGEIAAVDDEVSGGDERGFVGGEEHRRRRVQASAPGLNFVCFGAASRTRNEDREQGRAAPP